jgi:7-carboxy-7-deazaguanine synthase
MKDVKYTELFNSVQGEGSRTGKLCTWVRFFACNLNCNGFGQKEPTKPETHVLPYQTISLDNIKKIEELPLFTTGCDTSHSWSARYKHLAMSKPAEEVANDVRALLVGQSFTHPVSRQRVEHVFTGGEPMMQQQGMMDIVNTWIGQGDFPEYITIETNGTRKLSEEFRAEIIRWRDFFDIKIVFSVSQKLFNVAGEPPARGFKPEVIAQYADVVEVTNTDSLAQLKYVLNNDPAAWDELMANLKVLRDKGVTWDVWIMPVGASYGDQVDSNVVGKVADKAIEHGFHVSGRMHVVLWGNDQHGR